MKQSQIFAKTSKTISNDLKVISHKLLYKAGFIRESAAGRYYFLPLGMRVRDKIVKVIEEEMDRAGAIKIITPVLHPLELWQETNRTESAGFELMTIKDRSGSQFALGGTAEEMMVDLVRKFELSYRDLPFNIYQFSQKFRDEKRARGGLLRVREFLMKDAYSFHADEVDFKREYQKMRDVYKRIFDRLGVPTIVVESDNGYIGGEYCHEFIMESEVGESRFLIAVDGSYAAHEDVACFQKEEINQDEEIKDLIEIDAVRGNTMEDGVKLHNLPLWRQIKDVMFVDDKGRFILAIIRGDYEVNECKLIHAVKANEIRPATEEEVRSIGSVPGFISPIGMDKRVIIVADDSLRKIKNAYGGANKKNKDCLNINIDRDYQPNFEADIAMAKEEYLASNGQKLKEGKGIEVGNIFQLGYHYSQKMKATFQDVNSQAINYYMGCYGIGIDRTMAAIIERYNDEHGMIWPEIVAPFKIHLVGLFGKDNGKIKEECEKIYSQLLTANIEVLYDDRNLANGEKFADADLIGCPYRVVVSEKTLKADSVEVKKRDSEKCEMVKIDNLVKFFNG